jgi:hypothetical protein
MSLISKQLDTAYDYVAILYITKPDYKILIMMRIDQAYYSKMLKEKNN